MGRDAVRVCRAETRRIRHRGRPDRLVPPTPRRLQMSALRGVRRDSQNLDRQTAEIQAAGYGQEGVTVRGTLNQTSRRSFPLERESSRKSLWIKHLGPRGRGDSRTTNAATEILVQDDFLPEPFDFVLDVQFLTLEFRNLEV